MPQYRKTFFSLGGPTEISAPSDQLRENAADRALRQQQIGMQRAAQQEAAVRAQQEMALKAMLAQQGFGMDRERMAQQQAQFDAAQQARAQQQGRGFEHEQLMAKLAQEAQQKAMQQGFGQKKELLDLRGAKELDLAKLTRGWGKEDTQAAEGREEKRYQRRRGEDETTFQRRLAEQLKREQEAERKAESRAGRLYGQQEMQHEEAMGRQRAQDQERARRNAALEDEVARKKALGEWEMKNERAKAITLEIDPLLEALRKTSGGDEQNAIFDTLMRKADTLEPMHPGIRDEVLNMLRSDYKNWDAPSTLKGTGLQALGFLAGTKPGEFNEFGEIATSFLPWLYGPSLAMAGSDAGLAEAIKAEKERALREALGSRYDLLAGPSTPVGQ